MSLPCGAIQCCCCCAQVLNFSIAYGKTAHGLSRDWGTSLTEAQDTVERWYADRPEVSALVTRCMQTERAPDILANEEACLLSHTSDVLLCA